MIFKDSGYYLIGLFIESSTPVKNAQFQANPSDSVFTRIQDHERHPQAVLTLRKNASSGFTNLSDPTHLNTRVSSTIMNHDRKKSKRIRDVL
jgi:hypothetical protein